MAKKNEPYRFPVKRRRKALTPPGSGYRPETISAAGPFIVQGQSASDLEDRVYRMLRRLGWPDNRINFQVSFLGGRRYSGGQVIDFVVLTYPTETVIRVQGTYWHGTAAARAKDLEGLIRLRNKGYNVFDLYSGDLVTDNQAYGQLLDMVGRP